MSKTILAQYKKTPLVEEGVFMYLHRKEHLKFPKLVSLGTFLSQPWDVVYYGENPHEKRHGQSLGGY